jgi:uncharacterized membrane protein
LSEEARPKVYLYGLSLGSLGVESIVASIDIVNEPIDGALMVGPPFLNDLRARLVGDRDPGTTPAAPIYEDGKTVRFADESGIIAPDDAAWGDTRIVYLQHATDPVVFFAPDLVFGEPDWLRRNQRHVELDDEFRWIPIVTMWQVLTDMTVANSVPTGFGHVYSIGAHVSAWAGVIGPDGWTDARTSALRHHLMTG